MPKTKQTKADFVRALPRTLSASQVIDKAKGAGFKISAAHVYAIRSSAKRANKSRKQNYAKTTNGHATNGHAHGANGGVKDDRAAIKTATAVDLLRAVASELGLPNAISILQTEHDKVQRLIAR